MKILFQVSNVSSSHCSGPKATEPVAPAGSVVAPSSHSSASRTDSATAWESDWLGALHSEPRWGPAPKPKNKPPNGFWPPSLACCLLRMCWRAVRSTIEEFTASSAPVLVKARPKPLKLAPNWLGRHHRRQTLQRPH